MRFKSKRNSNNLFKLNIKSTLLFLLIVLVENKGVFAGKDQERSSHESQDNEPAGSNTISMTASSGQNSGNSNGNSGSTRNKYGDKYSSSSSSSSSSIYPSASQQHSNIANYYGAYNYPNMNNNNPYSYNSNSNGNNNQQSTNNYYNPYMSEPYYERNGRDFSTRSSNNIVMPASSTNFGYESTGPDYGGQAMATNHGGGHGHGHGHGHGGGHGGHGGGHGWGWKGASGHSGGKMDTSALGLLGLIGLLSLLQQVLMMLSTTTTTTMRTMGRKKRNIFANDDDDDDDDVIPKVVPAEGGIQKAHRISLMVLPAFNIIAHARNGRVPLECTHREVCVANQILVKELGIHGRTVGSVISSAVSKLLKEADKSGTIGKHVSNAGIAGRNGENCQVIYPVCPALEKKGVYSLPLLMQPHHVTHITPVHSRLGETSYLPRPNVNSWGF